MKKILTAGLLICILNVQAQSLCEQIKSEIYAKQTQAVKDGKLKETQRTPMRCVAE